MRSFIPNFSVAAATALAVTMTGCNTNRNVDRATLTGLEDKPMVLGMSFDRRQVIAVPQQDGTTRFIAEAPPEIVERFIEDIREELKNSGSFVGKDGQVVDLDAMSAEQWRAFVERSYGIQLFQNAAFQLATIYASGANEQSVLESFDNAVNKAAEVTIAEVQSRFDGQFNGISHEEYHDLVRHHAKAMQAGDVDNIITITTDKDVPSDKSQPIMPGQ